MRLLIIMTLLALTGCETQRPCTLEPITDATIPTSTTACAAPPTGSGVPG